MATTQEELIKQILEFPYGVLELSLEENKGFNKSGYLSAVNMEILKLRLKKYNIIAFEFGTFYPVTVVYNISQTYPKGVTISSELSSKKERFRSELVYAIYIDETGNCYGHRQHKKLAPRACEEGNYIPWDEELFVMPFVSVQNDNEGGKKYDIYKHHWSKRRRYGNNLVDLDIKPQRDITSHEILTVLKYKNLKDIGILDKMTLFNVNRTDYGENGSPLKICYSDISAPFLETDFGYISRYEIYRCLKLISQNHEQKIPEEDCGNKKMSLNFGTHVEYIGQLYEKYKIAHDNLDLELGQYKKYSDVIFNKEESEKFLLMYRKLKAASSFDKLKCKYHEQKYLSINDIIEPEILLHICKYNNVYKYIINLVNKKNTLDCDLDDIILLLERLKGMTHVK